MDLLQYSFTLDPGHSMDAVRERVAARRHLLDALPGLRWKAWLLCEPLPGRHQPKTYAPLYLFDDADATHDFLCSDIYRGVTDAFGWTSPYRGTAIHRPVSPVTGALSCTLTTRSLHDHAALRRALTEPPVVADTTAASPAAATRLQTTHLLDVSRMQLRSYTFWTCRPQALALVDADADADVVYEVVAVSAPPGAVR